MMKLNLEYISFALTFQVLKE